jgi:alpha-tubulin suppressor-like RCC1 family protein
LLALLPAMAACHRPSADLDTPDATPKTRKKRDGANEDAKNPQPVTDERWLDVAIQSEFGCAVERTGAVYCWGRGPDADMNLRELPPQPVVDPYMMYGVRKWGPSSRVEIVKDATKISAARARVCAIVEDGRVRCWGSVMWGSNHVFDVPGLRNAIDIEVGDAESCAVLEDGAVWCFSAADFGVPRKRMDGAIAVAVNDSIACGLSNQGDIACWGQQVSDTRKYSSQWGPPAPGPSPSPNPVPEEEPSDMLEVGRFRGAADISISWSNLCVLRTDGKVVCSDRDIFAVLRGEELTMNEIPDLAGAVEVMATGSHTCARTADERVKCWGRNVYGQLGDGTSEARQSPVEVKGLTGVRGLSIAEDFTCARTKEDIQCWGFDRGEAIFREQVHVHTLPNLTASSLSSSQRTTCAVDQNQKLRCWGSDMLESFGIVATSTAAEVAAPMKELAGMTAGWESCYLSSDGQLSCGTWNWYGSAQPTFMITTSAADVRDLAAGQPPSCTIEGPANKAKLLCGGSMAERKHISEYKANPVEVSARNMRACVADDGGNVSCFGFLYYWGSQPAPPLNLTKVAGVGKAASLASSSYHDCALSKAGKVTCWVGRTETQWGPDGQPISVSYKAETPKEMTELGDTIVQITAGNAMLCALDKAGAVKCWDDNPYGQEGTRWLDLPKLEGLVEISAGFDHTCGRHKDGKVTCWGDDVYGQLGRVPSRVYLQPTRLPID